MKLIMSFCIIVQECESDKNKKEYTWNFKYIQMIVFAKPTDLESRSITPYKCEFDRQKYKAINWKKNI